jgi:hypothetical protein
MLASPDRRLRVQQVVVTAYPMIAVGMAHAVFLLRPWLRDDQGLRLLLGCLVLGTCTVIPLVVVGALVVLNNSMTEWRRRPQGLTGGLDPLLLLASWVASWLVYRTDPLGVFREWFIP